MSDTPETSGEQSVGVVELLTELIHAVHLTPTQRVIVRALIQNADRAAYLSGSELADIAAVSQPSVTRLATALGFEGYRELRNALRESRSTSGVADDRNDWQRSVDFEIAALKRLWQSIGREAEIRDIAAVLTASRPLVVAGHRSAVSVSSYFAYFAGQFLPDVRIVPAAALGSDLDVLVHAKSAGATSMFITVFPPYGEDVLALMDQAHELGIEIVCLTDNVTSPALEKADHQLIAPVHSTLIFDSYGVPMIAANVLLAAMAEINAKATQKRLEHFDAIMERNKIFRS